MKLLVGDAQIAYDVHGTTGPWVTFSHSLGCTRHMWQEQISALARDFRVLAYDLRGHGESNSGGAPGSLNLLASDVHALLDHLGISGTHFVGISIGGMIGQTLAIESPDRIASLVLANTTAFMPPPAVELWAQRVQVAQDRGVVALAQTSMERWFPAAFRKAQPEIIARMVGEFASTSVDGYVTCCQAIMGLDTRAGLAAIRCPTLIVGGTEDPGAPAEALTRMNQQIAGSQLVMLEGAGHLSNIDQSGPFTATLTEFLRRHA